MKRQFDTTMPMNYVSRVGDNFYVITVDYMWNPCGY